MKDQAQPGSGHPEPPSDGTGFGTVNAHTHLYSGLVPLGMPAPRRAPRSFVELLESVWWRLDRALDQETLRASAELYVAEAIELGTAVLIDHHESPNFIEGSLEVLAEVCEDLEMPVLLCYGATERNGGPDEARRGLAECRRLAESLAAQPRGSLRAAVGLHASFTVSDATIRAAGELAGELGAPLHVHVAEDRADVEDAQRRGFDGVVDRLERLGALRAGSILAHGVHLTRDEVERVAQRGCWLVQNPRSNRGNRVGYPAQLAASSGVVLGTDGYPSDLFAEAEALREDALRLGPAEATAAARRLASGGRLAAALFPGLDHAPPRVSPERLAAIRERAASAAARLWDRMASL